MANDLFLLWLAALLLMGSPGPATLSLAAIGTAFGFRCGLPYLCGIVVGTACVLLFIATGVTAVILTQPILTRALTFIGSAYILFLAVRIATAPVGATAIEAMNAPTMLSGLVLALANPKAYAAIGAVYAGHSLIRDDLLQDTLAKICALAIVVVIVNTAWLAFGSIFSTMLNQPRLGRLANLVFAVMLVASVGAALLSK